MRQMHCALLLIVLGIVAAQREFPQFPEHLGEPEPSKNMHDLKDKAEMFKNQFVSLTSDALELQCKQLEAARASGKTGWLEKKGADGSSMSDHLGKLCDAMRTRHPDQIKQVAHGAQQWVAETAKDNANFYKASALGCNTVLKAQNDGKMEWFETQPWYKKTLEMCKSLSQKNPMELEDQMRAKKGEVLSKLGDVEEDTPIELVKHACSKLEHAPSEVHEKPWYVKAHKMCSTVGSYSPDDLKEMLKRLKTQAESGSGQLITDTCSEVFKKAKMEGRWRVEQQPWFKSVVAMCGKLGHQQVHASVLEQRCQWLETLKHGPPMKLKFYQGQPWYKNLARTCMYIQSRHEVSKGRQWDKKEMDKKPVFV